MGFFDSDKGINFLSENLTTFLDTEICKNCSITQIIPNVIFILDTPK